MAEAALQAAGRDVTSCFRECPRLTTSELAKAVGLKRAPPLGLKLILYAEAAKANCLRGTAMDILFREILCEFPHGWSNLGMSPSVLLSGWMFSIGHTGDMVSKARATAVLLEMTKTNPPKDGWLPQDSDDPLIRRAFDLHWPDDEGEQSATATG